MRSPARSPEDGDPLSARWKRKRDRNPFTRGRRSLIPALYSNSTCSRDLDSLHKLSNIFYARVLCGSFTRAIE